MKWGDGMDLISREALLKLFVSLKDEHETNAISYNALYEVILQQPTIETVPVENIKRIVERFEEMKMRYFLTIGSSGSANLDSVYEEVGNCIDRAIAIVKGGGGIF